MRKLIVFWVIGAVTALSGCTATSSQNQAIKPSNVRVSGDINAAVAHRSGF
jgi:hypothetical protein